MNVIDIKKSPYLEEYCELCNLEWGVPKSEKEMNQYIQDKKEKVLKGDKVISVLGLVDNNILIGFISLFKYDGNSC